MACRLPSESWGENSIANYDFDVFSTTFFFGGIPHDEAEKNMRLFADRALPVLQNDSAFAAPPVPSREPAATSDLFAPA